MVRILGTVVRISKIVVRILNIMVRIQDNVVRNSKIVVRILNIMVRIPAYRTEVTKMLKM